MTNLTTARLIGAALTALALGAATAPAASAEAVKVGFAAEPYPPFFEMDAAGNWGGWELDLAKAVCQRAALDCTFVPTTWDGLIPELTARKIDMITASMSITDERKKAIAFSSPYYRTPAVLVGPKSTPEGADPATLKGKVVGVQQSTIHQAYAEKHFPDSTIKVYATQDEANQDLISGRLDVVQADIFAMDAFVKGTGAECCHLLGALPDDPAVLGIGVGFGMRKDDTELKTKVDGAIASMLADGSFDAMTKPVFGDVDVRPAPAAAAAPAAPATAPATPAAEPPATPAAPAAPAAAN